MIALPKKPVYILLNIGLYDIIRTTANYSSHFVFRPTCDCYRIGLHRPSFFLTTQALFEKFYNGKKKLFEKS